MLRTAQETAAGRIRQTKRDSGTLAEDPRTWRLDDPCRIAPSGQMVTTSECRSDWLRAPATNLTHTPVAKAAGVSCFCGFPIACASIHSLV